MRTREELLSRAKEVLFRSYEAEEDGERWQDAYFYRHEFCVLAWALDKDPDLLLECFTGKDSTGDLPLSEKLAQFSHLTTDTYSGMILPPKETRT